MPKSIGIDLGTTNTVACYMEKEGRIILNNENDPLTPSVVALTSFKNQNEIRVGKYALDCQLLVGKNFIYSVKRLMGRGFSEDEVQKMRRKVSYKIVPSPDGSEDTVRVVLGDKLYTPQEISAMILKKIKDDAEKRLGDKVDSAVITVPAYFSEKQRYATREAGLNAGLKVKKILDEPSAAAIAYGIELDNNDYPTVLVFDLGGGTFDVSIIVVGGGNFQTLNVEGDMWLGGDDFDNLIVNQILDYIKKEYGIENFDDKIMSILRKKAKKAKEILSSATSAPLIIQDIKDESGIPIPIEYEITRDEFELLLTPYVEKAMEIVKRSLDNAGLSGKEDIDEVLLVGGSSNIPAFQKALKDYFGENKIKYNIDPMTSVALGAAILAKSMTDVQCECGHINPFEAEECEKCGKILYFKKEQSDVKSIVAVTPQPYGIELEGGIFEEIIPKNSEIPTEEPYTKEFQTSIPNQRIIKVPVYQGFSSNVKENEFMGNIWFRNLPDGLPKGTPIEISMSLDKNMIFYLECRVRGTAWRANARLEHSGWKNKFLDEAMDIHIKAEQGKFDQSLYNEINTILNKLEHSINMNDREGAEIYMEKIKVIKEQNEKLKTKKESPIEDDTWKIALQNIIKVGKDAITVLRPILPNDILKQTTKFENWCEDAKQIIDHNDKIRGDEAANEGWNMLITIPLVGEFVLVTFIVNNPSFDPGISSKLSQVKEDLEIAIKNNDVEQIKNLISDLRCELEKAIKSISSDNENPNKPTQIYGLLEKIKLN